MTLFLVLVFATLAVWVSQQKAPDGEGFSLIRWAQGIFDPLNLAKSTAHAAQIGLLILGLVLLVRFGGTVRGWLLPATKPTIGAISGGTVDNSTNKTTKNSLLGLF